MFNSVVSECSIKYCDNNYCNGTSCTQCEKGYFKIDDFCNKCYIYCKACYEHECYASVSSYCLEEFSNCSANECNTVVACSRCPDGFYLSNNRCYRCNNINCKCKSLSGCDECLPGYYGNNFCNNKCPGNCISCTGTQYCPEFLPGKFNRTCDLDCLNTCVDGTCDIDVGTCETTCASNQYLNNIEVCVNCTFRCSSCTEYGKCTSCIHPYYWGTACQFDCAGCFTNCNKKDGCSGGCDLNYYKYFSQQKEGYECIRCPEKCVSCDGSETCSSCKHGYLGNLCQFSCNNCGGICDKNTGCGRTCLFGHYPDPIDSWFECRPCSENCSMCINSSTCILCEDGNYVDETNQCFICPENCKDNVCVRTNGTCTVGCNPGKTGYRCDKECPYNCLECDQFNLSYCQSCKTGFYGEICDMICSFNCQTKNGVLNCEKHDGSCVFGCKDGFWSKDCSQPCSEGCLDQICNETDASCLYGCKSKWYGDLCLSQCNQHCLAVSNLGRVCEKNSGHCLGQCQDGWYGLDCSLKCVDSCYQNRCVEADSQSTLLEKEFQSCKASIAGLSVSFTVMVLVAVVSIVSNVMMYRRVKTAEPLKEENDLSTAGLSLEASHYQDLNRNRQDDGTYTSITYDYENNF